MLVLDRVDLQAFLLCDIPFGIHVLVFRKDHLKDHDVLIAQRIVFQMRICRHNVLQACGKRRTMGRMVQPTVF